MKSTQSENKGSLLVDQTKEKAELADAQKTTEKVDAVLKEWKIEPQRRIDPLNLNYINTHICYFFDVLAIYGDGLLTLCGFGLWQKLSSWYTLFTQLCLVLPVVFIASALSIPLFVLALIFTPFALLLCFVVAGLVIVGVAKFWGDKKFSSITAARRFENQQLKELHPAHREDGTWDWSRLARMIGVVALVEMWVIYRKGVFRSSYDGHKVALLYEAVPNCVMCRALMYELTDELRKLVKHAYRGQVVSDIKEGMNQ